MPDNKLYYGDNLDVLRRYVKDESIDLVYLDPPFNSRQDYNVLFAEKDGTKAASQIMAFEDTWEWNIDAERAFEDAVERGGRISDAMRAFRTFLGNSDMMAYLAMMAPRLVELHRVLKVSGSIYLHCDPTASHYLKMLMDSIFSPVSFRNELVWKRSDAHSDAKQGAKHFGRIHDVILFYSKGADPKFHTLYNPLPLTTQDKWYRNIEEGTGRRFNKADVTGPGGASKGNPHYDWKGITRYWRYNRDKMEKLDAQGKLVYSKSGMVYEKRYLDESKGVSIQDWWDDISMLRGISDTGERLGYPTQKPEALLERIIKVGTDEGDIVLDPFCGCGTAVAVAEKLKRRWVGIDITHLAINLIKKRLRDHFGEEVGTTYDIVGEPVSVADAAELAKQDPFQFQSWALGLAEARVADSAKKGADRGIDGRKYFHDDKSGKSKQIILSVKAGENVNVAQVRDLRGVIEREKAEIGVLISMEKPSRPMVKEAAEAGLYKSPHIDGKFPRLQILTIEQLLRGEQIAYPRFFDATFKQAPKVKGKAAETMALPLGDGEIEEPF
jgi:site-specific DNA-methyltransferase (adenine-specific)